MTKQKFIVQNIDSGLVVSSVGSKELCADIATMMNHAYQTDAYQVVPYLPGEDGLTK